MEALALEGTMPLKKMTLIKQVCLILICMSCALLAHAAVAVFDPTTSRFWAACLAVQVLAVIGFGASSLPSLAGWVDCNGTDVERLERKLNIIRGGIVSLMAANICYYGGYYYMGAAEVGCFMAAAVAAYGGDKFIMPLLSRITGKPLPEGISK